MLFDVYGGTEFEQDLLQSPELLSLVADSSHKGFGKNSFAVRLYASLCNTTWVKIINEKEVEFSSSWRYAAGLVAHLRNTFNKNEAEDYLNFYCSGSEGCVCAEVEEKLNFFGWKLKK
ncbi:MAG: hypothetical protein ACK5GV_11890 [Bacteroidota bacterium]|jgi:hypothetical protein